MNNFRNHLQETYNLSEKQVDLLFEEFSSYYRESAEAFIRRRHNEMKDEGLKNTQIYKILKSEIEDRRFSCDDLSERQIRRIIYG